MKIKIQRNFKETIDFQKMKLRNVLYFQNLLDPREGLKFSNGKSNVKELQIVRQC